MSKGFRHRPMQIPPEEFDQRWAETFGPAARFAAEMAEGRWEYDPKKSASYTFAMLRDKWKREDWRDREWNYEDALAKALAKHARVERYGQFTHRDPEAP